MADEVIPAKVTIHRASHMTEQGRHEIADWLRHCADTLEEEGHNYADRFSASYRYIKETVDG
jgi:hypothetical protein